MSLPQGGRVDRWVDNHELMATSWQHRVVERVTQYWTWITTSDERPQPPWTRHSTPAAASASTFDGAVQGPKPCDCVCCVSLVAFVVFLFSFVDKQQQQQHHNNKRNTFQSMRHPGRSSGPMNHWEIGMAQSFWSSENLRSVGRRTWPQKLRSFCCWSGGMPNRSWILARTTSKKPDAAINTRKLSRQLLGPLPIELSKIETNTIPPGKPSSPTDIQLQGVHGRDMPTNERTRSQDRDRNQYLRLNCLRDVATSD